MRVFLIRRPDACGMYCNVMERKVMKNMKKIEPYSCYEVPMYVDEERRNYGKTSNAAISKLIKYVYELDFIIEKKVK